MKKTVLIYKSDLLPYSETFIKEQLLACKTWSPVLVGTHLLGELPLDELPVKILHRNGGTKWAKIFRKIWRETGLPFIGVLEKLRALRASLVHVHFGTELVTMWPVLKQLGVPVLVTLHGSDIYIHPEWWTRDGAGPASRKYPGRLRTIAAEPLVHFVAVSEAVRQRAISYGIPAEKITVRYIGVDLNRFQFRGERIENRSARILFVGRMVEKKGGAYLIEAFAELRKRLPHVELVMIGSGPLLDSYKAQAEKLGAPVQFLGRRSTVEVRQEFERARVFCLPSITAENGDAEGLPIVVMEAQACGVPVVTSARGGATEGIENGVTGFSFAERDVAGLTEALFRVLADPAVAQSMSDAAQVFARKRFDITRCTQALEAEYDRIAATADVQQLKESSAV